MNRSFRGPETLMPSIRPRMSQLKSLQSTMNAMREKEDDLALFLEMRKREKEKADLLLLQDSDELDEPLVSQPGSSPLFDVSSTKPARKPGADDFLNSDGEKNDYDWIEQVILIGMWYHLHPGMLSLVLVFHMLPLEDEVVPRISGPRPELSSSHQFGEAESKLLMNAELWLMNDKKLWLLTPPGTPLFPSLEMESRKTYMSELEAPKAQPTALKSRLANSQTEPAVKSNLIARQSTASTGLTSSGMRRPSSAGGPASRPATPGGGSRSATPTGRPTLTSKSSRPSTPTSRATLSSSRSTVHSTSKPAATLTSTRATASLTSTRSTASVTSTKSTVSCRSSTPSRSMGRPSAPSNGPTRSSTPSRSTARSSTPTRSTARSSTPTARPTVPASRPSSRASTPTHRPSTPSTIASSTAALNKSSSSISSKSGSVPSKNPGPSRGASPTVRSRPWNPAEMPGFSLDAPPNLRTTLPNRPLSATRGRPAAPSARSASVEPPSDGRQRRQSCSPSRGRAPNGGIRSSGSSVPAVSRGHSKVNDDVSPVVIGTKMVERVINMRKLAPPRQDDRHSPGLSGKSASSPDSSGFGRTLSKKSLDMAIRHMTLSPTQSRDTLVTDGPLAHPPIGALGGRSEEAGLALIPLFTGSLPFPHKACLIWCASPPLISLGRSHHFSDVELLSDIRRSIPGNLRPLMTKIPASSMYSVRSGPTGSWTASVSDSPLATSSASSERSVNNNHAVIMDGHGSELEDDLVSERGGHACPNIVHGL
ncbi:hypothetical protein Cgig2_001761 [Carnegiea gigantea]|uniref:Uncharacterized protein n=1 Tax=Carnegiea gigantea TaxID=171969 RepID=A0A9Q1K8P5_9CARY|nr:hypothetical protein Cgig2_001761 [Carnegiea gigantea]